MSDNTDVIYEFEIEDGGTKIVHIQEAEGSLLVRLEVADDQGVRLFTSTAEITCPRGYKLTQRSDGLAVTTAPVGFIRSRTYAF